MPVRSSSGAAGAGVAAGDPDAEPSAQALLVSREQGADAGILRTMHPTAALETNLWSMWSQLGQGSGCALGDQDGVLWVQTPLPVLPYNMVLRYQGSEGDDRVIDEVFARFEARGVPFLWFVHPSARPADLPARLRKRGFDEDDPLRGMVADLEDLPPLPKAPPGVELVEVTPETAFSPFIEFVANRWQVPEAARSKLMSIGQAFRFGARGSPNRAWLVVRDGEPLAKAVTHESHDSVGLYGMATQVEARGLGLGRLVCIKALSEAHARGRRVAVLHSTPMAVSLYESVGFREEAPFRIFAKPGSFHP